jgi:PAS domain S-box-containing protein
MGKKKSSTEVQYRKKAEDKFYNSNFTENFGMDEEDPAKLLHELRVHQIELELQNEELRLQRDKADEATKKYSDLYSEINDFTPVAFFTLALDGRILEVNRKASELLVLEREKLTNWNFLSFLSAESTVIFNECLRDLFNPTGKSECEIHMIKADKSKIYARIEATLSKQKDKCLVMAMDITERILMEEAIRNSEKKFRESEKKLTLALENGKIGFWEWSLDNDMIVWDHRMEGIFGFEPGAFDGKRSTFENLIHEDDIDNFRLSMNHAISSEENSMESVFRIRDRIGKCKYIMTNAVVIKDNNKPVTITGVCFDVTKIQEGAEKHIVKLNEELLRSNNDLSQFAYITSHDLQEPLRMVTSFMQMLQRRYEDKLDEDAVEYIHFAVDGAKRMYELLNGLLAYSRIQSREHEFSKTDLNKVFEKVRLNLNLIISESDAEISCDNLPVINADETQMGQLLQNLIENGVKFSSRKPKITITSLENYEEYIIKISDNGIGIEPQYHDRIFRIFQRLHPYNEYKGTGIGLAICKRIVERHGGKIWVESVPGEGSAFLFTIPFQNN